MIASQEFYDFLDVEEGVFAKSVKKILPLIQEKIKASNRLLDEAVKLSEEFGIPFKGYNGNQFSTYIPKSFDEKFSNLSLRTVEGLTKVDVSFLHNHSVGWSSSSDDC